MFIHPFNIEGFYYKELSEQIQHKIIEDKITNIIKNLEHDKYSKYLNTINLAKKSPNALQYREFLKKHNYRDIIEDIISDERIYDSKGNPFNITKKGSKYILFLTKSTFVPVKLMSNSEYDVYLTDTSKEIPVTNIIKTHAPTRKIAKEIAFHKFIKNNANIENKHIKEYIHKVK